MFKPVKTCACGNRCEGNTDRCASCNAAERKLARLKLPGDVKPIKQFSDKRAKENAIYVKQAKAFVRGKKCAVFPDRPATQVHHMQGRVGYADEWARENGITLLMDKRFWLPVSDEGHQMITDNSKWAWENKFSFKRVTDPIFRIQRES